MEGKEQLVEWLAPATDGKGQAVKAFPVLNEELKARCLHADGKQDAELDTLLAGGVVSLAAPEPAGVEPAASYLNWRRQTKEPLQKELQERGEKSKAGRHELRADTSKPALIERLLSGGAPASSISLSLEDMDRAAQDSEATGLLWGVPEPVYTSFEGVLQGAMRQPVSDAIRLIIHAPAFPAYTDRRYTDDRHTGVVTDYDASFTCPDSKPQPDASRVRRRL